MCWCARSPSTLFSYDCVTVPAHFDVASCRLFFASPVSFHLYAEGLTIFLCTDFFFPDKSTTKSQDRDKDDMPPDSHCSRPKANNLKARVERAAKRPNRRRMTTPTFEPPRFFEFLSSGLWKLVRLMWPGLSPFRELLKFTTLDKNLKICHNEVVPISQQKG
jgi:hypothetical protein